MTLSEQYIKIHKTKDLYLNEYSKHGYTSFCNRCGWKDYIIDKNLIYSHRINKYTKKTFTEGLHSHEYYELIIYIDGNVNYITDNCVAKPEKYSVICFLPGQMHTATLVSDSEYERYVFYFSKDFFVLNNTFIPLIDFINHLNSNIFFSDVAHAEEIKNVLRKIDDNLNSNDLCGGLIAKALIIELFGIFNSADMTVKKNVILTDFCMEIKNYIDNEYASISTSGDIAQKFHYSREHISRTFKNTFNISVSDYISKRRVLESLPLLNEMSSSGAAYEVGFKSQSTYIAAFKKNMGCLPSEYKKHKYDK